MECICFLSVWSFTNVKIGIFLSILSFLLNKLNVFSEISINLYVFSRFFIYFNSSLLILTNIPGIECLDLDLINPKTEKVGDLTKSYIEQNREVLEQEKKEAKRETYEPSWNYSIMPFISLTNF